MLGRLNNSRYMILWLLSYIGSWLTLPYFLAPLAQGNYGFDVPYVVPVMLLGILPALMIGIAQRFLINRAFNVKLRGWLGATLIGGIIGGLMMFIGETQYDITGTTAQTMMIMAAPTLAQFWVLRRHVSQAWLWILAGIMSGIAFALPFNDSNINYNSSVLFASLIYGAAMGGTSLALMKSYRRDKGKVKSAGVASLDMPYEHLQDGYQQTYQSTYAEHEEAHQRQLR